MNVGYLGILLTGLATSLHCVSMCGTLVLTYSISSKEELSRRAIFGRQLSYNAAKLLSYTVVGALAGLLGSVLNLSGLSGWVSLLAGLFMIAIGLNMFGILPRFDKPLVEFSKSVSKFFMGRIKRSKEEGSGRSVPVLFGLMSGLMPCGPLQAMILYAAGTGSFLEGGTSLFVFGLGTVPLMLAFGTFASLLSNAWKSRVLKLSAVVIIGLGLVMVNRGLMIQGSPVNFGSVVNATGSLLGLETGGSQAARSDDGAQEITIQVVGGYSPDHIEVEAGRPVRISFQRHEVNACSKEIVFPDFGIKRTLPDDGVEVVEFTPEEPGDYTFTCGMGMLYGSMKVLKSGATVSAPKSWADRVRPYRYGLIGAIIIVPLLAMAGWFFRQAGILSKKKNTKNKKKN